MIAGPILIVLVIAVGRYFYFQAHGHCGYRLDCRDIALFDPLKCPILITQSYVDDALYLDRGSDFRKEARIDALVVFNL